MFIAGGGTVQNDGSIDFDWLGSATTLDFLAGGAINGAGQFNFTNSTNNQVRTAAGTTVTHAASHTITGSGTILNNNGSFVNNGTINSTSSQRIIIDPDAAGSFTNNGVMSATGSGGFQFNGGTFINNTQIDVATGSKLDLLQAAKITGGTTNTTGTGVVNVNGNSGAGSEFDNVIINGNVVQNNSEDATVTGTFQLNGTWAMNSAGTQTNLNLNGGITLDGNGTIDMSNSNQNRIVTDGNDVTVGTNFTIVGAGQILADTAGLINNGTIQNDQTQSLTIDPSAGGTGFVNNGTLEVLGAGDTIIGPGDTLNNGTVNVTGTGKLDIGAGTFTNTGRTVTLDNGGDLEVNQSTVFEGGTIQSNAAGSEVIVDGTSGAGSTFSNVIVNADMSQANSRDATVTGTFSHDGVWSLNSANTATVINMNDGVVVNGTGKILTSNNSGNQIRTNNTVVTFGANYDFEGAGSLLGDTGGMVNNGDINATLGAVLTIDPNALGFVNNGTINATGVGGIDLNAGTYTNNGSINVGDASRVDLKNGVIINGGTLTTAGTGKINIESPTAPGATLNNVVLNGNVEQNNANDATVTGTFTHNGLWDMNSAGTATTLSFNGGVTINVNSVIDMSNNVGNQILTDDSVITLGANATIQGGGNILVDTGGMVNNGTITANQNTALTIDPNAKGFVNNGSMDATGLGGLVFNAGTFTNNTSIDVADGSKLDVGNGTVIDGGVINTTGTGVVNLNGNDGTGSVFNNVTVNGDLSQGNNEDSTFTGGFTHNTGTFGVNSAGSATFVSFNGGITVDGTGVMDLSNNVGNVIQTDNTVVTVGNSYTIKGGGQALADTGGMVNNGTLIADENTALIIDPNALGFTNNGTMQATGLGGFVFNAGTFTNNSAIDVGDGSKLDVGNGTIVDGGVINTTGTGVVNLNGNDGTGSVFNNVTVNGDLSQGNNEDSTFTGTLTHNSGTFAVNSAGTPTFVSFNASATITGTDVMDLSNNVGNIVQTDGTTMTVGNGYTIEGSGSILNDTGGMNLQGTLRANKATVLTVNPGNGQSFSNQGLVEATNGATVNFTDSTEVSNVQSGGTELVGGAWKADANSTINLTGANITTNNANVTLNGVGSTFTQINNIDTNGAAGSFNILADRVFNTVGNLDNAGNVVVDGAGSQLNVAGVFTQTGGSTTLNGGTLDSQGGAAQFTGGTVNGSGNIMGGADFTGTTVVDTGASPGIINITGDALLDATIIVEIDGTLVDGVAPIFSEINGGSDVATTEMDQINIDGVATIGTLTLDLSLNFGALDGDFFDLIIADSFSGDLSTVVVNGPAELQLGIVTFNDPDDGQTRQAIRAVFQSTGGENPEPVPVPGAIALMAPVLGALGFTSWRQRRKARKA